MGNKQSQVTGDHLARKLVCKEEEGDREIVQREVKTSKVMSLLFNTLLLFVIAILPKSKCLLLCGESQEME